MDVDRIQGIAVARASDANGGTAQLADQWGQQLLALTEGLDPPVLVVDLAGVQQMRPRAMAGLVQAHRRLQQRGGQLVLAGVAGPLSDLIQITGFGREIHIAADCDEAIQHVLSPPDATGQSQGPP